MRNKVIALIAAIGISFAVATPANAQFWGYGGYYPGFGYGGWGYGGYGYGLGMMGAGLAVGALAGAAIAASNQPYYGGYYEAAPQVVQRKQIIIRNSPGARVIEQDIFDW
jgi:hypothetical protein